MAETNELYSYRQSNKPKRQLKQTADRSSQRSSCRICRFVGGGAVLFDVLNSYDLQAVYISDINAELINTYAVIRDNVEDLCKLLQTWQNDFLPLKDEERRTYYNNKREEFNSRKMASNFNDRIEKAALFIFLNKTCFNGLYRVNRRGLFNVPPGAYKKPPICDRLHRSSVSTADSHSELYFI